MCAMSMIMDHYQDKWKAAIGPHGTAYLPYFTLPATISREEFDALRHDVEEMKALLKRAKKYDADNGEPDCEMADKVALVKKVAELVGVDLGELID